MLGKCLDNTSPRSIPFYIGISEGFGEVLAVPVAVLAVPAPESAIASAVLAVLACKIAVFGKNSLENFIVNSCIFTVELSRRVIATSRNLENDEITAR